MWRSGPSEHIYTSLINAAHSLSSTSRGLDVPRWRQRQQSAIVLHKGHADRRSASPLRRCSTSHAGWGETVAAGSHNCTACFSCMPPLPRPRLCTATRVALMNWLTPFSIFRCCQRRRGREPHREAWWQQHHWETLPNLYIRTPTEPHWLYRSMPTEHDLMQNHLSHCSSSTNITNINQRNLLSHCRLTAQ